MMKNLLFNFKTLLVAVCLLGGANSTWAAVIDFKNGNRIGAVDNSSAWYADCSEIITIGHHQTLTLKFKTYTATDEQMTAAGAGAWDDQKTHAINIWDGQDQNFFMKGCGWGWKAHGGAINDPEDYDVNAASAFYQRTFDWGNDYRTMIGDGADVVMTVARFGSELRISQEFTTSGGNKYYHYFVGTFGLAEGNVWLQVTTERAHIDITEDYSLTDSDAKEATGTLIGRLNNTVDFLAENHEDFTLKANETLNLHFKNYSSKTANANNWFVEIVNDGKYLDLQADKAGWDFNANGEYYDNANWTITPVATYWNNYIDFMDGADVEMTIVRSGSTITLTAVQTSTLSEERTISYSLTHADFASNDITVKLTSKYAHLDLLPVTKPITSAGWATFCSPYALNLAGANANLTDAYIVTGGAAGVLTKVSVKDGTVPANTGLLLKGTEGTVTIPIVGSSATDVSANILDGVTANTLIVANAGWVLMPSGTNGLGFYQNSNEFTVGANTAYIPVLDLPVPSSARAFFSLEGDVTGISTMHNAQFTMHNDVYDLQGRRVAAPTKGLYIVNGKKVVIK